MPEFRTAEGVFTVKLWNRNEKKSETLPKERPDSDNVKEKIYDMLREKGVITRKDIEEAFGIGTTTSFKYLKQLCKEGMLKQNKNGNRTTYTLLR